MANNELDLNDYVDFDLEQLEELAPLVVPAPGKYLFEGISLSQEMRSVRVDKDSDAETEVRVAVGKFKILEVQELAKGGSVQEGIVGTELTVAMQLEEVDPDGFFFKLQQDQMAKLTKKLKDAVGPGTTFAQLCPNFPGMQFTGIIINTKRKNPDTKEIRVSWRFDKQVVPV